MPLNTATQNPPKGKASLEVQPQELVAFRCNQS